MGMLKQEPALTQQPCRLKRVNAHDSFSTFKDGIDRLNRDLLRCFAAEGIEIPYPTAVEIQKDS